ncbi:alpha/beta fold hydrolase [Nonomuraea sp. SYSU D8015]|uniref:alpha/beta fold hydrolase n=1 Tax=Nonomuraea sp. SYSU D8015 TaxID=2593644 RepID=UPI0016608504|nr:alpha/beta hydrolase [Nonomuraea sp. SYSU D8015]
MFELKVPGATLYYEVREGDGPVLLFIPGGGADGSAFDAVIDALGGRFTAVVYDPRGKSRSRLDGPAVGQRVEVQREDAHRLLDHVARPGEPAYVFGSSAGAIVGLDLATRHPEQVTRVIAHEPPLVGLLPDPEPHHAFFASVVDAFHREGVVAAITVMSGGTPPPPLDELPGPLAARFERTLRNMPFFLEHELRQFTGHIPGVSAIPADKAVPAVGRESRGQALARPAELLAARLGVELAELPGGHTGSTTHPAEFAAALEKVIAR